MSEEDTTVEVQTQKTTTDELIITVLGAIAGFAASKLVNVGYTKLVIDRRVPTEIIK